MNSELLDHAEAMADILLRDYAKGSMPYELADDFKQRKANGEFDEPR